MACNPDFVQFIIDQCSDAGEIAVKNMMGGTRALITDKNDSDETAGTGGLITIHNTDCQYC